MGEWVTAEDFLIANWPFQIRSCSNPCLHIDLQCSSNVCLGWMSLFGGISVDIRHGIMDGKHQKLIKIMGSQIICILGFYIWFYISLVLSFQNVKIILSLKSIQRRAKFMISSHYSPGYKEFCLVWACLICPSCCTVCIYSTTTGGECGAQKNSLISPEINGDYGKVLHMGLEFF